MSALEEKPLEGNKSMRRLKCRPLPSKTEVHISREGGVNSVFQEERLDEGAQEVDNTSGREASEVSNLANTFIFIFQLPE